MKLKKMKDKFSFIDILREDDNESILKKIKVLQMLSCDRNPEVRIALARQLVLFDADETEKILYEMLFDKNRWVRLEAVDSLSIGYQEKTIEKVKTMVANEGSFIRAYAVSTLFDLITNRYGVNSDAYSLYKKCVSAYFIQEKNTRVLFAYYQNNFFMNNEEGLRLLEHAYMEAVEKSDYKSIWSLLHIFQEILNFKDQMAVRKIVSYKTEKLLTAQKELVTNIMQGTIQKKILIVDQNDTYLSHVVSAILDSMRDSDMEIETAGVNIGIVQEKEIIDFCGRHGMKQKEQYTSKRMINVYSYDYIICLNSAICKEKYSLCNIICFDILDVENDCKIIETCHAINQLLKLL